MNSFEAADDKKLWPRGMKLVHAKKNRTLPVIFAVSPTFPQSSNEVFVETFASFASPINPLSLRILLSTVPR